MLIFALVFCALPLSAFVEQNRDSTLYYVAVGGLDSIQCGYVAEAVPCATIEGAFSQIINNSRNTIINVGSGEYAENSAYYEGVNLTIAGAGIRSTQISNSKLPNSTLYDLGRGSFLNISRISIAICRTELQISGIIVVNEGCSLVLFEISVFAKNQNEVLTCPFMSCDSGYINIQRSTISNVTFASVPALRYIMSRELIPGHNPDSQLEECWFFNIKTVPLPDSTEKCFASVLDAILIQGDCSLQLKGCIFEECGQDSNSTILSSGSCSFFLGVSDNEFDINQLRIIYTQFISNKGQGAGAITFYGFGIKLQISKCQFNGNQGSQANDIFFVSSGSYFEYGGNYICNETAIQSYIISSVSFSNSPKIAQENQVPLSVDYLHSSQSHSSNVGIVSSNKITSSNSETYASLFEAVFRTSSNRRIGFIQSVESLEQADIKIENGEFVENETIEVGWYINQHNMEVELGSQLKIQGNDRLGCIIGPSQQFRGGCLFHLRGGMLSLNNLNIRLILTFGETQDKRNTQNTKRTNVQSDFMGTHIFAERGDCILTNVTLSNTNGVASTVVASYSLRKLFINTCLFNKISNINLTTDIQSLSSTSEGLFGFAQQSANPELFASSGALYIEIASKQLINQESQTLTSERSLKEIDISYSVFQDCVSLRNGGAISIVVVDNNNITSDAINQYQQFQYLNTQNIKEFHKQSNLLSFEEIPSIQRQLNIANLIDKIISCTVRFQFTSFIGCNSSNSGGAVAITGVFEGTSSVSLDSSSQQVLDQQSTNADLRFYFCRFQSNRASYQGNDVYWITSQNILYQNSIINNNNNQSNNNAISSSQLQIGSRVEDVFSSCRSLSVMPKSDINGISYDHLFSPSFTNLHVYSQLEVEQDGFVPEILADAGSPMNPFNSMQRAVENIATYTPTLTNIMVRGKRLDSSQSITIDGRNVIIIGGNKGKEAGYNEKAQGTKDKILDFSLGNINEFGSFRYSDKNTSNPQIQTEMTIISLQNVASSNNLPLVRIQGIGSAQLELLWCMHNPNALSNQPMISATGQGSLTLILCRLSPFYNSESTSSESQQVQHTSPLIEVESGHLIIDRCLFDPILFISGPYGAAIIGHSLLSLSIASTKFENILAINKDSQEQGVESAIIVGLQSEAPATIINCSFIGEKLKTKQQFSSQQLVQCQGTQQNCSVCNWQSVAIWIYSIDNEGNSIKTSLGNKINKESRILNKNKRNYWKKKDAITPSRNEEASLLQRFRSGGVLTIRQTSFIQCNGGALRVDWLSQVKLYDDVYFNNNNPNLDNWENYRSNVKLSSYFEWKRKTESQTSISTSQSLGILTFEAKRESFVGVDWQSKSKQQKNKGSNFAWIEYDRGCYFRGGLNEGGVRMNDHPIGASILDTTMPEDQDLSIVDPRTRDDQIELDDKKSFSIHSIPTLSSITAEVNQTDQNITLLTVKGNMLISCVNEAAFRIEIIEIRPDIEASPETGDVPVKGGSFKILELDSSLLISTPSPKKAIYSIPIYIFNFDKNMKYSGRIVYGLNGRKTKTVSVKF